MVTWPVRFRGDLGNHFGNDGLGHCRVFGQVRDDHLHGDMRLIDFPAIVVGNHRHGCVGQLRFPRALGLAQVRHADDIVTQFVVGE